MSNAYLVLSTGECLRGTRFGATGDAAGELVYNTGVVGYVELLTDPACYGLMITQTFPLAGNYGVCVGDALSDFSPRALIVREWCDTPSNFRSESDLDSFLRERAVVGLCGVDTRRLIAILREADGPVGALICDNPPQHAVTPPDNTGAVAAVSAKEPRRVMAHGRAMHRVALVDYGVSADVICALQDIGCEVTIYPYDTPAQDILGAGYDGIVLSDGPGDAHDNTGCIAQIAELAGKAPILAMGLGHQMLALSQGGQVQRLGHAHRGGQPVMWDGRVYTTTQNHGCAVVVDSVPGAQTICVNVSDNSCEGLYYADLRAISTQFRPDAPQTPEVFRSSGLRNTTCGIYARFIALMGGEH